MRTETLLQQQNRNFVDTPPAAPPAEIDRHPAFHGTDAEQVAYRVRSNYAHQGLSFLELSTCSRPFEPSWHDRNHKQWGKRRLEKAIDAAIAQGLIEANDERQTGFQYTGPYSAPTKGKAQ